MAENLITGVSMGNRNPLKIFSGNAHPALAKEICEHLQLELGQAEVGRFPDGEVEVQIGENVRGADVRSEEHTSELQSRGQLVCRLLPHLLTLLLSKLPTVICKLDNCCKNSKRESAKILLRQCASGARKGDLRASATCARTSRGGKVPGRRRGGADRRSRPRRRR